MGLPELFELPQVSPAGWRARIDYDDWKPKPGTTQLFIHWGGSAVPAKVAAGDLEAERAQLRNYERYHLDTHGWRGLAYDWAIGNSGTLYRVRGLGQSAATSGDVDRDGYSNNVEGEALLFIIGTGTRPSTKALATGRKVIAALGYRQIYGHREARGTQTSCPGPDLMRWIDQVRTVNQEDDDMPSIEELAAAVWDEELKDDATDDATVTTAVLLRRIWKEAHAARVTSVRALQALQAQQQGDTATAEAIVRELVEALERGVT